MKIYRLAPLIAGLLLIASALFFVRSLISLSNPIERGFSEPKKGAEGAIRHSLEDYSIILKNNPFGLPSGEIKAITAEPFEGPAILDLSLKGTVTGRRELSYAIISEKGGIGEVFKIGDSVFGIGRLKRIERDKVFLDTGGKVIEVPLVDIINIKEIKGGGMAPHQFGRKTGDLTYTLDHQHIQRLLENPEQIMTDTRLLPNVVDGKQQGFVLREVKAGGIFQSLGLQNGDVLLRVNEYNISHPEAALQALTALKGMDRIEADIIRRGTKMTLTYLIR